MNQCFFAALSILILWGGMDLARADGKASAKTQNPPSAFSLERYQGMIARSPFAVATQSAALPSAPDAGFTKDLVLTGAVRLNGGEYVTIASRDQTQRFGIMSGETYNGISVASVAWSDAVGKTKVTLKRGTEYGVVGFDEAAALSGPTAPAPPAGAGPNPNNGAPPANGAPALPAGVTPPNATNTPPQPGGDRPALRRRVINTAPAR